MDIIYNCNYANHNLKRRENMNSRNYMLTAKDVAEELSCSKQKAYKIIRECNEELKREGYITIAGKIPKTYWAKKMYGYEA